MDKNTEEIFAVKFTNANLGTALEFDPDRTAASMDVFCYSGETRKVQIIGQRRYMVNIVDCALTSPFLQYKGRGGGESQC